MGPTMSAPNGCAITASTSNHLLRKRAADANLSMTAYAKEVILKILRGSK
jgi:hypothetical protein